MCIERCDGNPDEECIYEPSEHHPAECDERLSDSNGNEYNPHAGSITPSEGRCNARLTSWRERYGEPRYCGRLPARQFGEDSDFCHVHKGRETMTDRAKELLGATTLSSKSIFYEFDHLPPLKKVLGLALYDSLVEQSAFDFEVNVQTVEVEFDDEHREHPLPPDIGPRLDENERLAVGIPVPTTHVYRCFCLAQAAFDEVKRVQINETIAEDGLLDESVAASGTNEAGQIVDTVTEDVEHPLNLAYSRLTKDRKQDLKLGGINVDEQTDVEVNVGNTEDLIMDVDPSPEATASDATMDLNETLGDDEVVETARRELRDEDD